MWNRWWIRVHSTMVPLYACLFHIILFVRLHSVRRERYRGSPLIKYLLRLHSILGGEAPALAWACVLRQHCLGSILFRFLLLFCCSLAECWNLYLSATIDRTQEYYIKQFSVKYERWWWMAASITTHMLTNQPATCTLIKLWHKMKSINRIAVDGGRAETSNWSRCAVRNIFISCVI